MSDERMDPEPSQILPFGDYGPDRQKNPPLAQTFLEWADETVIIKVIQNTYDYIDHFIDKSLPKEHVGYIIDRTGYQVFKEWVLRSVELGPEMKVAENLNFSGFQYEKDAFLK